MLRVAAGHAPAPCALWLMYSRGLVDRSVGARPELRGLGVAPAGFMESSVRGGGGWVGRFFRVSSVPPPLWRRLGAGGFNLLVVVCAGGPLRVRGGCCVRFLLVVPSLGQDSVLLHSGAYLTEL